MSWRNWRRRNPTLRRRWKCSEPRESCWPFAASNAAHDENQEGRGNDGLWEGRKTESRFPSLPTALGNRCAISTFPPPRRLFPFFKTKPKKGDRAADRCASAFRLIVR